MSMPPTTFMPDTNTTRPRDLCESSACHANKPLPRIKLNTDTINHTPTASLLTSLHEHMNTISRHGPLSEHDSLADRLDKAARLLVRHMIHIKTRQPAAQHDAKPVPRATLNIRICAPRVRTG